MLRRLPPCLTGSGARLSELGYVAKPCYLTMLRTRGLNVSRKFEWINKRGLACVAKATQNPAQPERQSLGSQSRRSGSKMDGVSEVASLKKRRRPQLKPQLRPTGTLCWMNPSLVTLMDPKRKRLIFVLGVDTQADCDHELQMQQLRLVTNAGQVKSAHFAEPAVGDFRELREMVSKDFKIFTYTLLTREEEKVTDTGSDAGCEGQAGRSFPSASLSRLRSSNSFLVKSQRRGRKVQHSESRWPIFFHAMRQARKEGMRLSEDLTMIQNRDLDDQTDTVGSAWFNLRVPLGADPLDFTLFVHTKHDSAQQHLQRCLDGGPDVPSQSARLEAQWQGRSPPGPKEDIAQHRSASNGPAGEGPGSRKDSSSPNAGPVASDTRSGRGRGNLQDWEAQEAGVEGELHGGPVGDDDTDVWARMADEDDALAESRAAMMADAGVEVDAPHVHSKAGTDQADDSSIPSSHHAGQVNPDDQIKGLAETLDSASSGALLGDNSRSGNVHDSSSSISQVSDEELADTNSSEAAGSQGAGARNNSSGRLSRMNSTNKSSSISSVVGVSGADAELAEFLLGRTATKTEVAQLCAAFAQAAMVESSMTTGNPVSGKHVAKLRQVIDSLINGTDRAGAGGSASKAGVQRGCRQSQRRLKLAMPKDIEQLATNKAFVGAGRGGGAGERFAQQDCGMDAGSDAAEAVAARCMRQLRVSPQVHRYVVRKDIVLVVGQTSLHAVASAWDRLEKACMARQLVL